MHRLSLVLWMLVAGTAVAQGSGTPAAPPKAPEAFEFEQYQVVILRKGDKWSPQVTPAVEELQKQHLAHFDKLAQEGKLVLAGPLSDSSEPSFRGICLYRVKSADEARKLAEADPAVKAGRLKIEVMTWNVGKGYVAFPKAPPAPK